MVTVVGGGVGGLVAAITAAETGAAVQLLEAHARLGGRARSTPPPYVRNEGPHVVYADGAAWAWLRERDLVRPYRRVPLGGMAAARFRYGQRLQVLPPAGVVRLLSRRGRVAPVDLSFRDWVTSLLGPETAAAAAAAAGVVTFTADPGRLSAAFTWSRLLRAANPDPRGGPRYVGGGWGGLVRRLETRARDLGVHIETGVRVEELSAAPAVVATSLAAARVLLGRDLPTPATSGRTALLDVAVHRRRGDRFLVSDLDEAGWVEQFSWADRDLAPAGESLFQTQMPVRDGEAGPAAQQRAEALLEMAAPGWRQRTTWRSTALAHHRTGALDLPGYTWRDRPAIDQGDGLFLVGDEVAAPGTLGEVSFASACRAGTAAAKRALRPAAAR